MAPRKTPSGELHGSSVDESTVRELRRPQHSSEALLRSLAENLGAGGVVVEHSHRVVWLNSRVHDHAWARKLGLVSFAGHKLQRETGEPVGVPATFGQPEIQQDDRALFETLAGIASQVTLTAITKEEVERKEPYYRSLLHSMHEDIVVIVVI